MPTEIALCPWSRARFNPMAYSRSARLRPVAIHSFDRQDLQAEPELVADSRRDVVASTNAALDYLQALYELHGDCIWRSPPITNGENGVARAHRTKPREGLPTDT